MTRIAICDDDDAVCSYIEEIIIKAVFIHGGDIDTTVFYNGESLVKHMKEGNYFEIIFLDIELDKMNGVSVGHQIREVLGDDSVQIIYISAKDSYAMELFAVRPMNFLVKPISKEILYKVLEQAYNLVEKNNVLYEYKANRQSNFIATNKIQFFEVHNRKIIIHTQDDQIIYYGKMSEVTEKLKRQKFLRISRSELVNYDAIEMYKTNEVRLYGGEILSITRSRQKEVQEQMMSYAREVM